MEMKLPVMCVMMSLTLAIGMGQPYAKQSPEDETAPCRTSAQTAEVHQLYGDADSIMKRLEAMDTKFNERRMYLFMSESAEGAALSLYTRADRGAGKMVSLTTWRGASLGDLREQISSTILANRGKACIGEMTRGLLKHLKLQDEGTIPAPNTARAAFSHAIKDSGDAFLRVSIFLLC